MVDAKKWGISLWAVYELVYELVYESHFHKMKVVLEMNGGDSCTKTCMHLTQLNCTPNKFLLCIFCYN
jgi:hypothetical protein